MTDRITVSQNFSLTQQEVDDLIAEGVTSAGNLQNFRFFTNDFDTDTSGVDIVATTAMDMAGGTTDFSLAFNYTSTDVTKFEPGYARRNPHSRVAGRSPRHSLFNHRLTT